MTKNGLAHKISDSPVSIAGTLSASGLTVDIFFLDTSTENTSKAWVL